MSRRRSKPDDRGNLLPHGLKSLGDEVRLKLHLATMEAKERWSKSDSRVKLDALIHDAESASEELGRELRQRFRKILRAAGWPGAPSDVAAQRSGPRHDRVASGSKGDTKRRDEVQS